MENYTDNQLIEAIKNGNEDAHSNLYNKYQEFVYKYLLSKTKDKSIAFQILSQTFDKTFNKIGLYEDRGNKFSTWLIAVAKNTLVDYYRKKQDSHFIKLSDDEERILSNFKDRSMTIEEHLIDNENIERLLKVYESLSFDEKQILNLKYINDMSYKEISEELNITLDLVKVRLFRAKNNFKSVWSKVQ